MRSPQNAILGIVAIALLVNGVVTNAGAQTQTQWIGGTGNWNDAANWDNGVPNGNFSATVRSAVIVTQDIPLLMISDLTLDHPDATLNLDNNLDVAGSVEWIESEVSGTGTLSIHGYSSFSNAEVKSTVANYGHAFLTGTRGILGPDETVFYNKAGATIEVDQGTTVGKFSGPQLATIVNEQDARFIQTAASSANYVLWDVTNNGTIDVSSGSQLLFVGDFEQGPTGVINLNGGGIDFFNNVSLSGKVTGSGFILNAGAGTNFDVELSPGNGEIGALDISGGCTMTADTELHFQIGPGGTSDKIRNVGGDLQFNGTINLEALAGAIPGTYTIGTWNNSFMVMDNGLQFGNVPAGFSGTILFDGPAKTMSIEVNGLQEVIGIDSVNVVRGTQVSGDLAALAASDDDSLVIETLPLSIGGLPISIELTSFLANASPSSLTLHVESSVSTLKATQKYEFFNFDTGEFERLGSKPLTQTNKRIAISPTGDISRFIEPGTGKVVARLGIFRKTLSRTTPWQGNFDRVVLTIEN